MRKKTNLMSDAFVYILKHTSGSTVKVGETTGSPDGRLQNYSKTYQLKGFSLHKTYKVPIEARKDVERRALDQLDEI